MPEAVYRILTLLCLLVVACPIGTNLGLLHLLWMLVSGRLLAARASAVVPGLSECGLAAPATRRAWAALGQGGWSSAALLARWAAVLEGKGALAGARAWGLPPGGGRRHRLLAPAAPGLSDHPLPRRRGESPPRHPAGPHRPRGQRRGPAPPARRRSCGRTPGTRAPARTRACSWARRCGGARPTTRWCWTAGSGWRCSRRQGRPAGSPRTAPPGGPPRRRTTGAGAPPPAGGSSAPCPAPTAAAPSPPPCPTGSRRGARTAPSCAPSGGPTWCCRRRPPPVPPSPSSPSTTPATASRWCSRPPCPCRRARCAPSIATAGPSNNSAGGEADARGQPPVRPRPETCQRLPELALAGAVLSYAAATAPAVPTGFWDRRPQPTPGRLPRFRTTSAPRPASRKSAPHRPPAEGLLGPTPTPVARVGYAERT